jgi:hypothetical protein
VTWLRKPYVPAMLKALATGEVPLAHDGLNLLSPWRSVAYLRDLLVEAGVLPPVDRHLLLLERWLDEWLGGIDDVDHRRLLELFATWYVLRRLRERAEQGPVGQGRCTSARYRLRQSADFLAFLADRGLRIEQCRQADIDAWFADGPVGRRLTAAFLHWCIQQKRMTRLTIPNIVTGNPLPISQHRLLTLIRQLLSDEEATLLDRVLGLLVLLYAQPASHMRWLTLDDVADDEHGMTIRLGDPASPVPESFADVLRRFGADRPNMMTATNPNSILLFSGRRAGQPMGSEAIRTRLAKAGIPILTGRTAALRQLVLQTPAPVAARMLGYTSEHAEAVAAEAGGPWKTYAPGDSK